MNRFVKLTLAALLIAAAATPAMAIGTYAEGQVYLTVKKFESSGIIFESWEGTGEVTVIDPSESCKQEENECYTPKKESIRFSVRPETDGGKLAAELQKNINKEVLVSYRIHRITAMALSSGFEITGLIEPQTSMPSAFPAKMAVRKTGAKRNFSVLGRIIRLEYAGTAIGTYEGLYVDGQKGKVHPFSITEPAMAEHVYKVMALKKDYNIGVSQAFVTGVRKSDYDVFEINLNEPAGASDPQPVEEKKPQASDDKKPQPVAEEKKPQATPDK